MSATLSIFVFFLCSVVHSKIEIVELQINDVNNKGFLYLSEEYKFSWKYSSETNMLRGLKQEKYEILIYSDLDETLMYSSGVRESSENTNVYLNDISTLKTSHKYKWKVKSCLNQNENNNITIVVESSFSYFIVTVDDSFWENHERISWLAGGNLFRTDFLAPTRIYSSLLFVAGLGYHSELVNGKLINNEKRFLEPTWSNYNRTIYYSSYEIELKEDEVNSIEISVGNGWYVSTNETKYYGERAEKCVKVILQIIHLNNEKLTTTTYYSNSHDWKVKNGPIVYDSIYNGMTYDSTLTDDWKTPITNFSVPLGKLKLSSFPSVTQQEVFDPISIRQVQIDQFLIDFGQNFAGVCDVVIRNGKKGQIVELKYAELVTKDGKNIDTSSLGTAKQTDRIVLNGVEHEQRFLPEFTYHGFRYVLLSGLTKHEDFTIKGIHFYTNLKRTGSVRFDDHIYDLIQHGIIYSQQSNLMGIPTDCPQRNERLGWLGDALVSCEEAMYNFDMFSFYKSYLISISDVLEYQEDISDIIPWVQYDTGLKIGDPTWTSAYFYIIDQLYSFYGDKRILSDHFEKLEKYVKFLDSKVWNVSLSSFYNAQFGDWVPPAPRSDTLKFFTASFFWILNLRKMKEFAEILRLGEKKIKEYENLEEYYIKKFIEAFVDIEHLTIRDNSQTAFSLSFELDIFSHLSKTEYKSGDDDNDDLKEQFLKLFLEDIESSHNYHLSTGIIGTKYLFPVLSRLGYHDYSLKISQQIDYPSFGYMFLNGIDPNFGTLLEFWDAPRRPKGDDNSRNHIMFGSIGAWFYRSLAGIDNFEGVGFEYINIHPMVSDDMKLNPQRINASFNSIKGIIRVILKLFMFDPYEETNHEERMMSRLSQEKVMEMEVEIPINSRSRICIPIHHIIVVKNEKTSAELLQEDIAFEVFESGKLFFNRDGKVVFYPSGVSKIWKDEKNECLYLETGSGVYSFQVVTV